MSTRALRWGVILGGIGFLAGISLVAFDLPIGIPVFFLTAGIVGMSVYAFWMDTGLEIISLRLLVALIFGAFGLALTGLVAVLLLPYNG